MSHRRLIESIHLCFVILLFICLTGQCSGLVELATGGEDGAPTATP
jgi:hypothetical protein